MSNTLGRSRMSHSGEHDSRVTLRRRHCPAVGRTWIHARLPTGLFCARTMTRAGNVANSPHLAVSATDSPPRPLVPVRALLPSTRHCTAPFHSGGTAAETRCCTGRAHQPIRMMDVNSNGELLRRLRQAGIQHGPPRWSDSAIAPALSALRSSLIDPDGVQLHDRCPTPRALRRSFCPRTQPLLDSCCGFRSEIRLPRPQVDSRPGKPRD